MGENGYSINVRTMTADDVPFGMGLKRQAGFNQTEADWRRFLHLEPGGGFVAEMGGSLAGTVTTCTFGPVGWIAMVLVERSVRGRGIGTRLVERALKYLESRGVNIARLDATPRGRSLYRRLGFEVEYELARMEGIFVAGRHDRRTSPAAPGVLDGVGIDGEELDELVELDRRVTGTDRRRLLVRLHEERPQATWVSRSGDTKVAGDRKVAGDTKVAGGEHGRVEAYLMMREGANAMQIGPGAATCAEAGIALANLACNRCAGRRAFVDVPLANAPAIAWAESNGFTEQRRFTRMRRGKRVVDQPLQLWASSGPEKG